MNAFNPTPKQVFQASEGRIKKHASLISRPEFRDGLDTAMLEYCRQESATPDAGTGDRIRGAHAFVSVFLNLAMIPSPITRTDPDNLIQT